MKNILIIAAVFPPEPVVSAHLLYDLAIELSKNYNITVLRPRPSRPSGFKFEKYEVNNLPFKVVELQSYVQPKSNLIGRFRESFSFGKYATKYIKEHRDSIDFIYNDPWQLIGVNIVAKAAVKYGIPYVMAVQDIYPESLLSKIPGMFGKFICKILMPIDKYNERHAAMIHTISDKMVKYLSESRGIPTSRFICVRNWQDETAFTSFRPEARDDNRPFTFMYLGNVGPLAGLEIVIDAWNIANLHNIRLVIAGSGSEKPSLMKKTVGMNSIEFWEVPAGMVPIIQSQADVMLLPVKKGFAMSSIPSKLPAYMFSSKPILASVDLLSDTAGCITDADAGWVIEPENPIELADMIKKISQLQKTDLQEKGANGFRFGIENLSKSANLAKLIRGIKDIVK